ncbi:MAG TPA: hypothetical protein VGF40_03255 [Thermoanaerobaculia bacterium]
MKRLILVLMMALALPRSGAALETKDVLALVAMPLAVAAVADIADVPTRDVVNLATALNRANVPPTQFVQVVRYAPVAIVDRRYDPPFVTYVTTQVDRGLVGDALYTDVVHRYDMYGVTELDPWEPEYLVVERNVLPPLVVNRFSLDPVDFVAMPLAVAAVAELTDVPMNDLISLVTAMNGAYVPPAQFVEIVRYSPVVLLDDAARPAFIEYVRTDLRDLRRWDYAMALADRLRAYGADDLDVVRIAEPVYVTDADSFPAAVRNHPHGGPPGQLKKDLGLQTGAEVVHGSRPGRGGRELPARVVDRIDRDRDRVVRTERSRVERSESPGRSDRRNVDAGPPPRVEKPDRGRGVERSSAAPDPGRGNAGGQSGANPGKGSSGKGNAEKGKGKG